MSIPEPGKTFRLLNYAKDNVLVANQDGRLTDFNKHTVYNDQLFKLTPVSGLFYIECVYVGNNYRIYSRAGAVGVSTTTDGSAQFQFEEGSGPLAGYYRLVTPSEGLVITDSPGHSPGNYKSGGDKYEDQYFQFQIQNEEATKPTEA